MRRCKTIAIFVICAGFGVCTEAAMPASRQGVCDGTNQGVSVTPGFRAVRMIEDPGNDRLWLIERNPARPGWPARAIPVAQTLSCTDRVKLGMSQAKNGRGVEMGDTMIHAGERVLIVDETPASRAEIEAVALNNGRMGEKIAARLKIGGKLVTTSVVAPGRAVLTDPVNEGQR